jgi:hypothetical protein
VPSLPGGAADDGDAEVLQRRLLQAFELHDRVAVPQNRLKLVVLSGGQISLHLHDLVVGGHAHFEAARFRIQPLLRKSARSLRRNYELAPFVITLAVLIGRTPEAVRVRGGSMSRLRIPPVTPGLPSDLIAQRPDIREAEAQLARERFVILAFPLDGVAVGFHFAGKIAQRRLSLRAMLAVLVPVVRQESEKNGDSNEGDFQKQVKERPWMFSAAQAQAREYGRLPVGISSFHCIAMFLVEAGVLTRRNMTRNNVATGST